MSECRQSPQRDAPWITACSHGCAIALLPVGVVLRLLDPPMRALQRVIGERRMAYVFLLPNFVFFGLFVFLPIGINVVFSVTGGTALFPSERPYVGSDQFAYLFDCGSYLDPSSCREDHFWRGVANTARFIVFQVAAMVLFSLITALVLNMQIRGRGFFRAVYFFPVLLSPVVVALIWKWILQRDGLLNAAITALGGQKILFFVDPAWAMFWAIFVSVWAHMGFYTLILLAGLQAIPADLYEAAEMDATPTLARADAHHPAAAVAEPDRRHRAGADPGRADLRRGVRPHRRRSGHGDADGGAVHLRDRVLQPGAEFRPGGRCLRRARRRAVRADAAATRRCARRQA